MELVPLGSRVLVQRDKAQETYKGLIILPQKGIHKPLLGTVRAVGPKVLTVKPGDRVLFGRFSTQEIKDDAEGRELINERDIMAVVSDE